jgi:hypothetical protein
MFVHKKFFFCLHPSGTQISGFWLEMSQNWGIFDISEAKKCALWVRAKKLNISETTPWTRMAFLYKISSFHWFYVELRGKMSKNTLIMVKYWLQETSIFCRAPEICADRAAALHISCDHQQ